MQDLFLRNLRMNNPSPRTMQSIEHVLKCANEFTGKQLDKAGWADLMEYIEHMQKDGYKHSSIALHKSKLKQFYLFCFEETENTEYRKIAKRLSDHIEKKNLSPMDILTSEDIKRVLNVSSHERERCIVASLFESGMRVGELLNLRIKDVQMDEIKQEVIFHIPELPGSKTGARSVPCLEIYGYVSDWLKCHPNPSPDAPYIEIVTRWGIAQLLDRLFERAGITKPNNPHILRHSAITHAVSIGMQESAIKQRFWGNIGSMQLVTYVHLNEQMQSEAYRSAKGMGNGNGSTIINPLASRCVNCGRLIQAGSLCKTCEDAKRLSEENATLKADVETMRKDMEKINQFIAMGGMELLKKG
jgi:integrase/recombinase XerD